MLIWKGVTTREQKIHLVCVQVGLEKCPPVQLCMGFPHCNIIIPQAL